MEKGRAVRESEPNSSQPRHRTLTVRNKLLIALYIKLLSNYNLSDLLRRFSGPQRHVPTDRPTGEEKRRDAAGYMHFERV